MLSHRYTFKSDTLKSSYINGAIDLPHYLSSLDAIQQEELTSVVFDFKQRDMEEEIAMFESQQVDAANQAIHHRQQAAEAHELHLTQEKTKQLEITKLTEEAKAKQLAVTKQLADVAQTKPLAGTKQLTEEEKPRALLPFEQKFLKARTDFYEKEVKYIVAGYKKEAKKHRARHDRLQLTVIAGSALATSTTGATIFTGATNISITLKIVAAFLSLLVTIASGSMAYFKYKERSNDTQKAADTIEDDYNAVKLGTGDYKEQPLAQALGLFANHTQTTITEHKNKQRLLDQPPDAKSGQAAQ